MAQPLTDLSAHSCKGTEYVFYIGVKLFEAIEAVKQVDCDKFGQVLLMSSKATRQTSVRTFEIPNYKLRGAQKQIPPEKNCTGLSHKNIS